MSQITDYCVRRVIDAGDGFINYYDLIPSLDDDSDFDSTVETIKKIGKKLITTNVSDTNSSYFATLENITDYILKNMDETYHCTSKIYRSHPLIVLMFCLMKIYCKMK